MCFVHVSTVVMSSQPTVVAQPVIVHACVGGWLQGNVVEGGLDPKHIGAQNMQCQFIGEPRIIYIHSE